MTHVFAKSLLVVSHLMLRQIIEQAHALLAKYYKDGKICPLCVIRATKDGICSCKGRCPSPVKRDYFKDDIETFTITKTPADLFQSLGLRYTAAHSLAVQGVTSGAGTRLTAILAVSAKVPMTWAGPVRLNSAAPKQLPPTAPRTTRGAAKRACRHQELNLRTRRPPAPSIIVQKRPAHSLHPKDHHCSSPPSWCRTCRPKQSGRTS